MLDEESIFVRSTFSSEFGSSATGILDTPDKNSAASLIAFPAVSSSTNAVDIPELDPLKGGLYEVSQWFHVLEVTILLILCVIILVSSIVIICAVAGCKKLHSTPGFLMLALGACDIAIAIGSMVPSISAEMVGKWVFGDIICNVQVFATTYFSSLESCFIMLCAVDRGLAIAKPLSYSQRKHVYKRLFLASVAAFIIFNIPIPFLMVHLAEKIHYAKPLAACAAKLYPRHSILPFMGYALQFFVPGIVIIICYVFIGYKAIQSKRANQIRRNTQHSYNSVSRTSVNKSPECSSVGGGGGSAGTEGGIRRASQLVLTRIGTNWQSESNSLTTFLKHLKLCKMLLVVAIVYFLSFFPIFVYQVMVWVGLIRINMYHYKIINILQYFNGVIDGIVFYSMSQTFKDRVNSMFCQIRQKNENTVKQRHSACPQSSMQSNRNSSARYSKNPKLNAPGERRYTHQYLHVQNSSCLKKT